MLVPLHRYYLAAQPVVRAQATAPLPLEQVVAPVPAEQPLLAPEQALVPVLCKSLGSAPARPKLTAPLAFSDT